MTYDDSDLVLWDERICALVDEFGLETVNDSS